MRSDQERMLGQIQTQSPRAHCHPSASQVSTTEGISIGSGPLELWPDRRSTVSCESKHPIVLDVRLRPSAEVVASLEITSTIEQWVLDELRVIVRVELLRS